MVNEITSGYIFNKEQLQTHSKIYAGPGAGKTHFLVENVKNIITNNDAIAKSKSRKILCITYTNAAVDEIRKRLERYIDYVEAYTIHGFIIEHIIKPFQRDLIDIMKSDFNISVSEKGKITSQIEGLGILHGIDKEEIFNYIKRTNPGKFDTDEFNYSKKIMSDVEVDNNKFLSSISTGEFSYELKASNKINKEHIVPIKQYIWSVVRKLTHDEILYFGYRILEKNPTALYAMRVKFPFIFIDEFQDTNPLQTLIVKLIGQKSSKIIVVGDIAQSIYSFQGAKPSDFKSFCIDSESDNVYSISGNRRSTENIVNFCNFLRKADTSVTQNSIKIYANDEAKRISESKKIHFIIGESDENRKIINEIINEGAVVLTRAWAAAFDYIQNIEESQAAILKKIYNSYYNTPINIRDEIVEHNNVKWVRAFRFIFKLWESFKNGSFIDMLSALQIYLQIDAKYITPKFIFRLNNMLRNVFDNINDSSITYEIIQKFNNQLLNVEYADLKELFKGNINEISVFDEQDRDELTNNVKTLRWDTSYKLFTEVFSANSKYMTTHQAKGLEWDKVIVSLTPTRRDNINISDVFSKPQLTEENSSDEFMRMYYVACSRAKEDLYIHIQSGCTKEVIVSNLNEYIRNTNCKLEYEFLPI
ncbi:MAG: ATP-dependent helicase [Lachnospira sp.]|nr:ATP-dependent helicase [Lachnospira sp.]